MYTTLTVYKYYYKYINLLLKYLQNIVSSMLIRNLLPVLKTLNRLDTGHSKAVAP